MNLNSNKKYALLEEQISLIKQSIRTSPLNTILNPKALSTNPLPHILPLPQQLIQYICHLHLLISKLSQLCQHRHQSQNHLQYDLKTAIKFAQLMRNNVMKPMSAQQFIQDKVREYRVLLNVYESQEGKSKGEMEKQCYYHSIVEMKAYNERLQQRMREIQQKHQETESIQSLKVSNRFLKSQNQFLQRQNQLTQQRSENYLALKTLCERQQKFIRQQQKQIELKKKEIHLLIEENKLLQEKVYDYKNGDRKSIEQMNIVKDKFLEYFRSKKDNYQQNEKKIILGK